jgi:hypothetical protein
LRRHAHAQFSRELQAFFGDRQKERQKLEEDERERAELRQKIETHPHLVDKLLKRRQQIPIDWDNPPDFEAEAALKLHRRNLDELERKFSDEAFLYRLIPYVCDFASYIAAFEHPQMPRTSRSKRGRLAAAILAAAPPERVAAAIVELVFARPPIEVPPTPGAKIDARFSAEKVWDLFRAYKEPRLLLGQKIEDRLHNELAQMSEDRRAREEMVDACQTRHYAYAGHGRPHPGISNEDIAKAARMAENEFYRWRNNNSRIGAERTRRILLVLLSPAWPPPQI